MGLPRWLSDKESATSAGDTGNAGSIPGLGRSPGGGNGNPLQYSCLGNPMDRGAWRLQFMGLQKVKQDLVTAHAHIAYYTTIVGIPCPFSFLSSHSTKVPSPLGVGQGDLILQVNQL